MCKKGEKAKSARILKKSITCLHSVKRAFSPWENNKKLFAPVSNSGPLTKMASLAEAAASLRAQLCDSLVAQHELSS